MKKYFIFTLYIFLTLEQKTDKFGEPDEAPKENFKFLKKMNLPGYNPTAIINKPPNSVEYKSNNVLPYGEWNNVLEKERNNTKFFYDKNSEKLRTSIVDFNEEKIFKQVYPEEFEKINWIKSLPKNNIFISKNAKGSLNQSVITTGTFHNYPQTNYFYSSLPNYQPVNLPKIENEPVLFFVYNLVFGFYLFFFRIYWKN